jgi:hypothetical protein
MTVRTLTILALLGHLFSHNPDSEPKLEELVPILMISIACSEVTRILEMLPTAKKSSSGKILEGSVIVYATLSYTWNESPSVRPKVEEVFKIDISTSSTAVPLKPRMV